MKQIQLNQFDPARLLTYVLSRLVQSHAFQQTVRKSEIDAIDTGDAQWPRPPARTAGDMLKTAERRWPSRYY